MLLILNIVELIPTYRFYGPLLDDSFANGLLFVYLLFCALAESRFFSVLLRG